MTKTNNLCAVTKEPRATLDLSIESDEATNDEVEQWKIDGAIYADLLYHPNCPPAFRKAFIDIFTEHLLLPCVSQNADAIRHLFPLAVLSLQGWIPADALRVVDVLRTLRGTLAPEQTKRIQKAMKLD